MGRSAELVGTSEEGVGTDLRVDPDDAVEAVGTEELRFKVLAKELSNEVGKRILQLLLSKALTTAQIAMALNGSIPTVAYHIDRMLETGIVRVAGYERSQKGKYMKKYEVKKPAILFIIDSTSQEKKESVKCLKKIALKKFYERVLCSIVVFATSYLASYFTIQLMTQSTMPDGPAPILTPSIIGGLFTFVPFLFGIIASSITYYALSRRLVSLDRGRSGRTSS